MNSWPLFHAYRHLADEGKVKHLRCPDDDYILVTRLGKDDEPALWCPLEDRLITPGLELMDRMRAVVNEHTE